MAAKTRLARGGEAVGPVELHGRPSRGVARPLPAGRVSRARGRRPQRALHVVEVRGHGRGGGLRVMRAEPLDDGAVVAQRPLAECAGGTGPLPADLAQRVDDAHELGEQEVARRSPDRVVERDVQGAEPVGIVEGVAQLGQERLEARKPGASIRAAASADVAHLHHAAGLDDLGQRHGVLGEHEVEMRHQLLGLQGRDVGPGTLADIHDLHDRERTEGLAQDGPADLHRGREVPLGRAACRPGGAARRGSAPGGGWRSPRGACCGPGRRTRAIRACRPRRDRHPARPTSRSPWRLPSLPALPCPLDRTMLDGF